MWDAKGKLVFRNLQIPVVVLVYFLVPCVALALTNVAFGDVHHMTWPFGIATWFILSLSFVVMLYILTVPDWPIGRLLQIDKLDVRFIRALISVNFGGSLIIAVIAGTVILQTATTIREQQQGQELEKLEARNQQLEQEKTQQSDAISGIRSTAILSVINTFVKTLQGIVTLLAGVLGVVVTFRTLSGKKQLSNDSSP